MRPPCRPHERRSGAARRVRITRRAFRVIRARGMVAAGPIHDRGLFTRKGPMPPAVLRESGSAIADVRESG